MTDRNLLAAVRDQDATAEAVVTKRRFHGWENYRIGLALLALVVVFALWAPSGTFLTTSNVLNIGLDASELLIIAAGMALLIISGGLDLSVGAVVIFSSVLAGKTIVALAGTPDQIANFNYPRLGVAITAGVAVAILSGLAWGAINGFVTLIMGVPSFVATLASLVTATGLAQVISGGQNVTNIPLPMQENFGGGKAFGVVPWPFIVAAAIVAVLWVLLAATRFGLRCYAIGGSAQAARRAGINVRRHMWTLYALTGALAGAVAVIDISRFGTASLSSHQQDALNAIAAVVIGGISLFGGRGRMSGAVIGVIIPAVLANGFVVVQVNPFWENVAIGLVLVAAVYTDQRRRGASERI